LCGIFYFDNSGLGEFMKNKTSVLGVSMLLLATVVWGLGFTMQALALEHIGACSLSSLRNILASLILIPVIMLFDKRTGRRLFSRQNGRFRLDVTKKEWIGGLCCGVILGIASTLQQIGIAAEETDSGKAAFITALYVVFVPVFSIFLKKRPRAIVWFSVVLSVIGFYLLSANIVFEGKGFFKALIDSGFRFATGDLMVLLCAVVFALHIIVIGFFSPHCDGIRLSSIQFLVAGVAFFPFMLILERPSFDAIVSAAWPILYLAACSSGIGYTAQVLGQKYVDSSVSAIILSLESVFGVIFGAIFLSEMKTPVQVVGCVIVLLAVVLADLPERKKKSKKE
jgi:drug/metabolite transporter (DMT)-like permease